MLLLNRIGTGTQASRREGVGGWDQKKICLRQLFQTALWIARTWNFVCFKLEVVEGIGTDVRHGEGKVWACPV